MGGSGTRGCRVSVSAFQKIGGAYALVSLTGALGEVDREHIDRWRLL